MNQCIFWIDLYEPGIFPIALVAYCHAGENGCTPFHFYRYELLLVFIQQKIPLFNFITGIGELDRKCSVSNDL